MPSSQSVVPVSEKQVSVSEITPCHQFVLSGDDFRTLQSPAVYIYEDADGGALYLGSGTVGASRAFQISPHQQPLRLKAQQECSRVRFVLVLSLEALSSVERGLIHSLHPKYNAACPTCDYYPSSMAQVIHSQRRRARCPCNLTRRRGQARYENPCAGAASPDGPTFQKGLCPCVA